jgi:hypothetical protein
MPVYVINMSQVSSTYNSVLDSGLVIVVYTSDLIHCVHVAPFITVYTIHILNVTSIY